MHNTRTILHNTRPSGDEGQTPKSAASDSASFLRSVKFSHSWCMLAEAATRAGDDTEHEWRATERRSLLRSHAASEPPLWASLDAEHVPIWRLDAKTTRAREWGALARYGAYRCQIAAGNEGQVGASRAGRTRPRTQPAVDILPSEISERPHSCFPLLLFLRRCTCAATESA